MVTNMTTFRQKASKHKVATSITSQCRKERKEKCLRLNQLSLPHEPNNVFFLEREKQNKKTDELITSGYWT